MNNLILSGVIASDIKNSAGVVNTNIESANTDHADKKNTHVTFDICVRHTTKVGKVKKEYFRVNTWNGMAEWAKENLCPGQVIAVNGYLTSRQLTVGDTVVKTMEICAKEILPSGTIRTSALVAEETVQTSASMEPMTLPANTPMMISEGDFPQKSDMAAITSTDFGKRLSEAVERALDGATGAAPTGDAPMPDKAA